LSCDFTAGSHVLDEAERSLHDALCVLSQTVQDARVIYGGGFPEMQMAKVSMWHCHASSGVLAQNSAIFMSELWR